jgi:hypothetical protein
VKTVITAALRIPLEACTPQDWGQVYRCLRHAGWRRGEAGKWHGGSMIRARSAWPEATRDFLMGRRSVSEPDIAYGALLWPGGHHLDESVVTWIKAALTGLGWQRERAGSHLWRKPR